MDNKTTSPKENNNNNNNTNCKEKDVRDCIDGWLSPAYQIHESEKRHEELNHKLEEMSKKVNAIGRQADRNALLMQYIVEKMDDLEFKFDKLQNERNNNNCVNNDENDCSDSDSASDISRSY